MRQFRKIILILVFLLLVRCSVNVMMVKNSNNVDARQNTEKGLDSGLDLDLRKSRDSIKTKEQ